MFKPLPLTNPASVRSLALASSTARLEGAETAERIGIPAITPLCTSSIDARPLTCRTCPRKGRSCSRAANPTTLSTALCRPTSSRTTTGVPSTRNSPAACRPPVRWNAAWAAASRSGSESRVVVETVQSSSASRQRACQDGGQTVGAADAAGRRHRKGPVGRRNRVRLQANLDRGLPLEPGATAARGDPVDARRPNR